MLSPLPVQAAVTVGTAGRLNNSTVVPLATWVKVARKSLTRVCVMPTRTSTSIAVVLGPRPLTLTGKLAPVPLLSGIATLPLAQEPAEARRLVR